MFGMGKRLKLPGARWIPWAQIASGPGFGENLREKLCLCEKTLRFQPRTFAGVLDRGEIDMCRQVLTAGIGQQIVADPVAGIGPQRAF